MAREPEPVSNANYANVVSQVKKCELILAKHSLCIKHEGYVHFYRNYD